MKATPTTRFPLALRRATRADVGRRITCGGARGHRITPQRLGTLAAVLAMLCTLLLPAGARAAPATSWPTVVPLPPVGYVLAAATGRDGRRDARGGYGPGGFLATVEAYSPRTNRWTTVAPLPLARYVLRMCPDVWPGLLHVIRARKRAERMVLCLGSASE